MSGNKEGGDVAAEGTGAETRTSATKSRPTGDQEWKNKDQGRVLPLWRGRTVETVMKQDLTAAQVSKKLNKFVSVERPELYTIVTIPID